MDRACYVHGRESTPLDVRVVCATNKRLDQRIASSEFHDDLFYRISEVTLHMPPLRSRPGDAMVLAQVIIERRAHKHGHHPGQLVEGYRSARR